MDAEIQRSWMFVPGNSEKMLTKAIGLSNLDVAMFDLEDGVPPQQKGDAAALVCVFLQRTPGGPRRFVRTNAVPSDGFESDLHAVVQPGLEGVVLPKIEEVSEILMVDRMLNEREQQR